MPEQITIVFGLAGGLAMFLFGMNTMSEALQKVAGEKMKKVLGFLTKNPVMGAVAGALVTAVLQSSSATTVMAIGFVSAGLIGLPQAISVIFGANIGTTMTAQLIAFKISDYIYPIIFIGFLMNFIPKKEKIRDTGLVIFSFGILFEGIEVMSGVMKPLASSPVFTDLMARVKDMPVLGVVLGLCMTLVVQSSSATIAVLQSFASQAGPDGVTSVIGLTGAIPILLGDNIGTTITALLASIGQSKDAKRTAIAHSTFNISGSILFLFLIKPLAAFVEYISPKGPEVEVISRQIANAHTTFNVVMTLIWLPLIPLMVRWVRFVIRGEDTVGVQPGRPQYLDENIISQPVPALYLVSEEVRSCTAKVRRILKSLKEQVVLRSEYEAAGGSTVSENEKTSLSSSGNTQNTFENLVSDARNVLDETVSYISKMFSMGTLDQYQAEEAAGMLAVANNMSRIVSRSGEIESRLHQMEEQNRFFSAEAGKELDACLSSVQELFSGSTAMLEQEQEKRSRAIVKKKNRLRKSMKKFNRNHLSRVKSGECDPGMTQLYSDILYNIDRMGDNSAAIAEEAMEHTYYTMPEQPPDSHRDSQEVHGEKNVSGEGDGGMEPEATATEASI